MQAVIWILVNSNNVREAEKIGKAVLKARLCACYGLYPKYKSVYFWPPHTNRLEQNKGPLLVLETLPAKYPSIVKVVRRLHSDKVPFIGKIKIDGAQNDFYKWLKGEIN